MNIYNQIVDPTKVTHSVSCHFASKSSKNLIVVKGTILQIFDLKNGGKDNVTCLSLVGSYKLHGQVTNIAPINTVESLGYQFLIVSTKFAKMSIIKWNFEINSIETVSLHYYECFFTNNSPVTDLDTADMVLEPNGKFVCMIFNNLLAFLPLRTDSRIQSNESDFLEEDEDMDVDMENNKSTKKSRNGSKTLSSDKKKDKENDDDDYDDDKDAIYKPTFAVPADTFIPNVKDIINIKFLKNYRSATMAVLYTPSALSWAGNLKLNKDTVSFQIASLDFDKNEYSTVITLNNLPYDLYDIIPLQAPLNGCLLIGCNELILVDSSGSSQGIITNKFTTTSTSYGNFSKDQSHLNLNLENCVISAVPKFPTRLLLISEVGAFYWVSFKLDGKNIRRFEILEIPYQNSKDINLEKISTATILNDEHIFVSCDSGDSLLLSMKDTLSSAEGQPTPISDDYDPDDDIKYEDEEAEDSNSNDLQQFEIADRLISCGPLTSLTLASLLTDKSVCGLQNPNYNDISFIGASGSGKNSAISAFSPSIKPKVKSTLKLSDVNRIWTLKCKSIYFTSKGTKLEKDYNYMVTTNFEKSASDIFSINDNFKNLSLKTGFRNKELIINIGFINNEKNIIQITKKNLYLYDLNFKLLKGISLREMQGTRYEDLLEIDLNGDEDQSTSEVKDLEEIVNGNIHDNFVMINTSKGAVNIIEFLPENLDPKKLKNRNSSDAKFFEQIDIPTMLTDVVITNGYISSSYLYGSISNPKSIIRNISKFNNESEKVNNKRTFSLLQEQENNKTIESNDEVNLQDLKKGIIFILVTGDNRVVVFRKEHKQRVFQLDRVDKLSENLNVNLFNNRDAYPDPYIKQAILVNLGDKYVQKEYLVLLTIGGETYFYELYYDKLNSVCKFRKQENMLVTGAPDNAFAWGTQIERRLIYVDDFANGLKCLFITGTIPFFVIKESHSIPRVYKFTKFPAITFAPFKLDTKDNKLVNNFFNFSDDGSNFIFLDTFRNGRICSIPYSSEDLDSPSIRVDYTNQLPIMKFPIGETIKFITYHESSELLVLSTFEEIDYKCIDEDGNIIAGSEEEKPHSKNYKGKLKLVSVKHWKVIDEVQYDDNNVALQVKSMYLNTSSSSSEIVSVKREKEVILAGISNFRMEDLAALGSFHVYEIIDIIPEKDKPEFNHKFKEIFKESTKGAVTAVTEVCGRFLISQGQKVIVRDLQEDNTVVPVAFLDTSIYVSEAKSFGNLLLLGDVMKSMWFVGFDAEPYRMLAFSKDVIPVDVNAGDFLCYNSDLFFVLADNNENLHILQFNPEDPASLSGQRLVRKVTFNINTVTSCMRKFPKKNTLNNENPDFQVVGANVDGSLYIVSPLSEPSYRRLYVLQQQIADKENHHLGLNPRANRISEEYEGVNSQYIALSMNKVKTLIDGELLKQFVHLNEDRKRSLAYKAGKQSYTAIWRDLVEYNLAII